MADNNFGLRDAVEYGAYDGNPTPRFKSTVTDGVHLPHTSLDTAIAGERNSDSASTSYLSVKDEWTYTPVSLVDNTTVISAAPAIIGNIWVTAALSAAACPIKDGANTVFSLPASAPATTTEATAFTFLRGTRCETSLVIDPDDAATGTIVVQWRPL